MSPSHRLGPRILLPLSIAAFLAVSPFLVSSAAQPASAAREPHELIEDLREAIRSHDTVRRESAIKDVIALATGTPSSSDGRQLQTDHPLPPNDASALDAAVDVRSLALDLLWAYRTSETDGHKLLALAGLVHIGNEGALEHLINMKRDASPRVEQATHERVVAFFVDRYPELEGHVQNDGELSIADIRQARGKRSSPR